MNKRKRLGIVFVFAIMIIASLAVGALAPVRANAQIASEGNKCVSDATASGQVSGYSYFVPGTIEIGVNETKPITLRTFVCNGTKWNVENDVTLFGKSVVDQTGRSPLDFSGALPNFFNDPNTWAQNMGPVAKYSYIYRDITVQVKGSAFDDAGNYTISIDGAGIVKYVSPQDGFNVGCGPQYGACATNVVAIKLSLSIKRPITEVGFTAKPVVQTPTLGPDDESANSVTFNSGISVSIDDDKPNSIKGGKITRRYEIRKVNGAIVPLPSPPDDNRELLTFSYPSTTRTGLSLQAGDRVCEIVTVGPAQGTVDTSGNVISGAETTASDEECARVVNKPYVSFYGNDVRAGGSFEGGNCNQSAEIKTFYRLSGKSGAGVQLAAMALGAIDQFGSANMRDNAPTGLTFANTGGGYGGNFGSSFCAPDYWSKRPSAISNTNSIDLGALPPGNYAYRQAGGTPVVISGATISKRIGVYVDGDVVIRGKVGYANSNSWASVKDIPSLNLIVRGNIFIDSSVNELEGVYVAQPENPNLSNFANGGRFYTCTKQNGDRFTATELPSTCRSRLTVTGAVVAQQVRFLRTIGTLRDATAKEPAGSSKAAEVFRFSPEAYLAPQPDSNLTGNSNTPKYDYYTALPPVL